MTKKSQAEIDETNRNMRSAMKMAERSDEEIARESFQGSSLQITTNLVATLNFCFMLSTVVTLILLTYYFQVEQLFNVFTILAIALTIILFIAKKNIKEFYILDNKKQAITIRRKVFSSITTKIVAPYKTIDASIANGRYNIGGRYTPNYWTYRAEIVLKNGKIIPISDWYREDFIEADTKAKKIADTSKCDFVQSKPNSMAKPIIHNGKFTFAIRARTSSDLIREIAFMILNIFLRSF